MKSIFKFITCGILIALVLLGFAVKYDTYGVLPGICDATPNASVIVQVTEASNDKIQWDDLVVVRAGYYLYPNRFGRTVVVEEAGHWKEKSIPLYQTLHNRYGDVILNVRTLPAAVPTHLDFLSIAVGSSTVYDVVAKCGIPNGDLPGDLWDLKYILSDGYVYRIGFTLRDAVTVVSKIHVSAPNSDGTYTSLDLEEFQWKVRFVYLGIAVVLSGAVFVLIKWNAKRKRKAIPNPD